MSAILHASSPYDNPTEAQKGIDEEIAQLEARIISLKTRRNDLSFFARLHPEVAQDILVRASGPSIKASFLFSWVCRSWRALVHQTSELWSSVDTLNPDLIEAALPRTQNRELSFKFLFLPDYNKDPNTLASLCLANLPRMRYLSIRSTWQDRLDQFTRMSPLWLTPAPVLVKLDLSYISLPDGPFSNTFPSLRNLHLHECEFDWDSLPVHYQFQQFRITNPIRQTSIEDLIQKIRCIGPDLETLHLRSTLLPSSANTNLVGIIESRHAFPKLHSLELNEESSLVTILNQLSLPSYLVDCSISSRNSEGQIDTTQAFVSSRELAEWPVSSLNIDVRDGYFNIYLTEEWDTDENFPTRSSSSSIVTPNRRNAKMGFLEFYFEMFEEDISNIQVLLNLFPISSLESADLSGGEFGDWGHHITNYLDETGGLERLNVSIFYLLTFTAVIHMQNQDIRSSTGWDPSTVTEEGIVTEEAKEECRFVLQLDRLTALHYYGEGGDEDYQFTRDYYMALREWLFWRKRVGLGVKELVFREMKVPPMDYLRELYEGVVDTFKCMGVVESTDESSAMALTV